MSFPKSAKPATVNGEPAPNFFEHLGGPLETTNTAPRPDIQAAIIRGELAGSDTATACGLTAGIPDRIAVREAAS